MSRSGLFVVALMVGVFGFSETRAMAQPGMGGGPGRPPGRGPAPGMGYVDIGVFYESLAPYGEWIQMPPYGWVWVPYNVGYDWRPYTYGYWIWTECGWTWVSEEPFGWATYHYGRWQYNPWYGWVWVPGTQWGPGWVAWRRGNGFVGWAPLPASTQTSMNITIGNFSMEVNQINNHAWSFMEERYMAEPNITHYLARPARNVTIIQNTHNITNYNFANNMVVNNSLSLRTVENRIKRPIRQYRINDFDRPGNGGIQNDIVRFFRPKLNPQTKRTPDVIFKNQGNKMTFDPAFKARQEQEKRDMEKRLSDERKSMQDRHNREQGRLGKLGISIEELKRRQEMEKKAQEEMEARAKKLVDRHYDRIQKGNGGLTDSKNRNRFDRR